ncbi:MAG: thiolase family protein [Planctomycetota bacterium]
MPEAVILEAVRTPFGKKKGAFRETQPVNLLSQALQGLVQRANIDPAKIEDVVTGNVTPVGEQGANIGRVASMLAEFPFHVPAVTLNRMCGSSQQAVHFASQSIAAGDIDFAIGCGVESMTRVDMGSDFAHVLGKYPPGEVQGRQLVHQGISAELIADKWGITRKECDNLAAESHRKAAAAQKANLNKEILPIRGIDAEGNPIKLDRDEGVRETINMEKMATLPTVFRPGGNGVVTAGNASQISDGASAVLLGNKEAAKAEGLRPRAKFITRVAIGDDPMLQLTAVIPATQLALKKAGMTVKDIDWFEINEAFATVVLSWAKEIKPDMEKVNPWGGAMAHGHPLGATGAGLMAKLVTGLEATNKQVGLQVMCIGHGMATCTIIERI